MRLILAALLALSSPALAAPTVVTWNLGGNLGKFLANFSDMRQSGEKMVIDGVCLSACTLALGLLPRAQICATPYAFLGFHSATDVHEDGEVTFSHIGTNVMWRTYPEPVKAFLRAHGWEGPVEHPIMIFASGDEIIPMVRRCDDSDMKAGE